MQHLVRAVALEYDKLGPADDGGRLRALPRAPARSGRRRGGCGAELNARRGDHPDAGTGGGARAAGQRGGPSRARRARCGGGAADHAARRRQRRGRRDASARSPRRRDDAHAPGNSRARVRPRHRCRRDGVHEPELRARRTFTRPPGAGCFDAEYGRRTACWRSRSGSAFNFVNGNPADPTWVASVGGPAAAATFTPDQFAWTPAEQTNGRPTRSPR